MPRRAIRGIMYLGIAAIVLVLSKVHARYVAEVPYSWHTSSRFAWSIAYIVLQSVISYGVGLPEVRRSGRSVLFISIAAAIGGAVGMSLFQLALGNQLLPRFVVFGTVILLVPWYLVCVTIAEGGRNRARMRDRVLLVGGADDAERMSADLADEVEHPAVLVGCLSVDDVTSGADRPLVSAVLDLNATVIVLDNDARLQDPIVAQAAALHERGIRVRTLISFYSEWLGKLPLSELERAGLMFDIGEIHRPTYVRIRRMIDVPLALMGMVGLVVLTPVVLLGNLLANRGPLLFRQERVGKNGRTFRILKFRTMRPVEGRLENEWTSENDPRITGFGKLMRRTHLDELPQVVNILRGDLAIVGPRPEQPTYVAKLEKQLAFYDLRHLVHPGLTGWAQVKYGYAGDENDALEKLQYEFYYLGHQSVWFDLRIMGRTIRSVFGSDGR